MAAEIAPVEPPDRSRVSVPSPTSSKHDGHRLLRLPGGEPRPRIETARAVRAVSVRRTVGVPERRASGSAAGRLARAGSWAVASSVIVGGSLLLYNMLFTSEGDLEPWLTSPFSSSLLAELEGTRPLT